MSDQPSDPRLREPAEHNGFPGELIDTPENMPGDQPVNERPPAPQAGD